MKRLLACVTPLLILGVLVAGCAAEPVVTSEEPSDAPAASANGETVTPDGFEPIPTDGAGEAAALAAVPAALEEGKAMREGAGLAWPALDGLEPTLVAYLVRADYDGQVALFEVRADGIAHNIYAFQKAFDSGSIIWSPAQNSQGPTAEPRSDREQAAVSAVGSAMADAFPGESIQYAVHGYRFVYLRDGAVVLTLEIDPEGGVISVGE